MSDNFRTDPVTGPLMRTSYAYGMRKPRQNDSGDDKYSTTLILPRSDTAGVKLLQDMVAECIVGKWGPSGVERFKKGLIKNPILDGDGKSAHDKDGNLRDGLGPDVIFIRPSSNDPVKVFNASVQPASDEEVVSGHWGYPVLQCFSWHNPKNGDGVSFGISMFQFVKKDEVLGGSSQDPNDFFKQIQAEGDAADLKGAGAGGMFDQPSSGSAGNDAADMFG